MKTRWRIVHVSSLQEKEKSKESNSVKVKRKITEKLGICQALREMIESRRQTLKSKSELLKKKVKVKRFGLFALTAVCFRGLKYINDYFIFIC